jgi:hypothetical protein
LAVDDLLAEGWFKPFCLVNIFTCPSLLAAVEIFFLNAIKRQVVGLFTRIVMHTADLCFSQPVPSHIFAIQFLAALYLGWAAIGKLLTGHNAFFWMDAKIVGSREIVAAHCIGFVTLSAGCFAFMFGLISMRDAMVERVTDVEDIVQRIRQEQQR